MRWIDRLADAFGSLVFLLVYNIATGVWVALGIAAPRWWPDPYPSVFYTLVVSWLAINMSSLVLWAERRKRERDERTEAADRRMLRAVYALVVKADEDQERSKQLQKSILALLESQMKVMEALKEEGDRKCR